MDTVLRDPLFPRLKAHLVESTGLAYYADKDHDLARRVARRLATAGISNCASYFELLRDPLRGPAELDELIAEITIGETYFSVTGSISTLFAIRYFPICFCGTGSRVLCASGARVALTDLNPTRWPSCSSVRWPANSPDGT